MLKPIVQNKLLFPEILWQKPLNIYQRRGRVLILSGEKSIKKTLTFSEVLFYSQIGKFRLAYSSDFLDIFLGILPKKLHFQLPSYKKDYSLLAYQKIKSEIKDFDLLVIGMGISENPENQKLIERLFNLPLPILLTQEGVLAKGLTYLKKEKPEVVFLDLATCAKIQKIKEKEIQENPILNLQKLALEFNQIFVLKNQEVWLANPQTTVVTNTNPPPEVLLGLISAFWSQNLKKPFESAVTAAFIAKIWQENFSKISELPKAINLAEKEIT